MVLLNVIVFSVLKIFQNLFIFNLSETFNSFVKINLVVEIKNVAGFIKIRFYLK